MSRDIRRTTKTDLDDLNRRAAEFRQRNGRDTGKREIIERLQSQEPTIKTGSELLADLMQDQLSFGFAGAP